MSGTATAIRHKARAGRSSGLDTIILTPAYAAELLEKNKQNRPISDTHVARIQRQIEAGKWKFNGDTIKISEDGDVLDGQHRLWAVILSKKSIETAIITGIKRDAFATIDTVRKPRSGADTLALAGAERYREQTASALAWLIRYQRGTLATFRDPKNRIENSDIEEAFAAHPMMNHAVEKCYSVRTVVNGPIISFLYYLVSNRNEELANRMIETMENPAGVAVSDPFYRLRVYLLAHRENRWPLLTIALCIKAINAAYKGGKLGTLQWRNQGTNPEKFPTLDVK